MNKFAIIDDVNVINIIVADSLEIAQQLHPDNLCVEYTEQPAVPGGFYNKDNNLFASKQPFPEWTLDWDTMIWEAPIPYPTDGGHYHWDPQVNNWVPDIV
jgi:hypothetical protein